MRIDGRKIAEEIYEQLKKKVSKLKEQRIVPHLVVILIGDDPASAKYVEQKYKWGTEIGAKVTVLSLSQTISEQQLIEKVDKLNKDANVHGIIIQRPLPNSISSQTIADIVTPQKDVDGFHPDTPFTPPIVLSALRMLEEARKSGQSSNVILSATENPDSRFHENDSNPEFLEWLNTKQIVLIGKGEAGGGPIIEYFKTKLVPCQVIDSKTENPDTLTKHADIIITSVGKPNIVRAANIKPGVILVGIGLYKKTDGKLAGDYNEEDIQDITSYYTPSPGGMGPVNVAMLLTNLIKSTRKID